MPAKGSSDFMKTKLIFISFIFTALGCAPQNPKLEAPVQGFSSIEVGAALQKIDVTPKVDILLVIDNSLSMQAHQDDLAANIKGFVDAFGKNKMVDFHFGMVPIYD